jgi:hypothetical protein
VNTVKHIQIVVEDLLSEAVIRRLSESPTIGLEVMAVHGKRGKSFIKDRLASYNEASKYSSWVVLVDLDSDECPPRLAHEWIPAIRGDQMVFSVAVREVESWLMADRDAFALFLGVSPARVPRSVETLADPKGILIDLARSSRQREIRRDIVPVHESTARVGRNYNGRLTEFVNSTWDIQRARTVSPSLDRLIKRLETLAINAQ